MGEANADGKWIVGGKEINDEKGNVVCKGGADWKGNADMKGSVVGRGREYDRIEREDLW